MTNSNLNYFKATASGSFSFNYGWDSGATLNNVRPISLDDAKRLDYHQTMGMFVDGKEVQTFDCNEYGGNRTVNMVICANDLEAAQVVAQSYLDATYRVVAYDGGGIRL